jgi:hypothetical protein
MKKISFNFFLVLITMVFVLCTKPNRPPQGVGTYPPHSMAGIEIRFDTLAWQSEDHIENVFIYIGNRPDLFMPFWKMDISLKLDTSQVWMPVNLSNGFVYSLLPGQLYISPSPADPTLAGRSASIKIKFR